MTKATKSILLVDDDPDFLEQQQLLLQNAGYDVWPAAGQEDAEKILKTGTPDAAVVDLMMEHSDGGFALCYHIKKKDPAIPVIIVTAVASEAGLDFDTETEEERSWVKADAMLDKPVRFEQLQKELNRLLDA